VPTAYATWKVWRWRPRDILVLVLVGAGLSWFPLSIAYGTWQDVRTLRKEWTVAGPACPIVEHPASWALRRSRPPMTVQYGGATFTRQFAAISCAAIPESSLFTNASYAVCKFNNPGAVTVAVGGRRVTYQPGVGQPATITVRHGVSSCVVGGAYKS